MHTTMLRMAIMPIAALMLSPGYVAVVGDHDDQGGEDREEVYQPGPETGNENRQGDDENHKIAQQLFDKVGEDWAGVPEEHSRTADQTGEWIIKAPSIKSPLDKNQCIFSTLTNLSR
jgi:hypothetical protein